MQAIVETGWKDTGSDTAIFLSTPDTRPESGLDADTIAAINSGGFKKVIITGGTAAVPGIVEEQLASAGITIERWMGDNRYETSVDIIEKSLQASGGALSLNNIICATGFNYPDALDGKRHAVFKWHGHDGVHDAQDVVWCQWQVFDRRVDVQRSAACQTDYRRHQHAAFKDEPVLVLRETHPLEEPLHRVDSD
jgi:hypothetical protein